MFGIGSNRAEVHALTATFKHEEAVELLEEEGIRLVDGAEDSLTRSSQLLEETYNVVGSLSIES